MCRTCKICTTPVGKGKSYCVSCTKKKKSDASRIWENKKRLLKTGFTKNEENTFLIECINNGIDTTGKIVKEYIKLGKHARSVAWIIKRLKELGIYKTPDINSILWERDAKNRENRITIAKSKGFSIINNDKRNHSKVKCNKCGTIFYYVNMIRNGCSACKVDERKKRIDDERNKNKSVKIEEYKSRVDKLKEFVNNENEYIKYNNYKETPINKEYVWYNEKPGIAYRETDLTYKLQWIGYYIYRTGQTCPDTPIKDGYKICRKCREHKDETNFSSNNNQCKQCEKQYRKEFILPNEIKKTRHKYRTNPIFKLDSLMRAYIYSALKGKYVKTKKTKEILGIEWNEFRDYIEDRFEDWMTWDNHGQGKGRWALQHIVPRDFVISEEELYVVNYYKNFIPMCAVENGILKNRILKDQLNEWHSENESIQQIIKRNEDRIIETIPNQI